MFFSVFSKKGTIMLEYNDTHGKNNSPEEEENFRRYEENHGLEHRRTPPDGQLSDPETEDLKDDESPDDASGEADITPEDLQALGAEELSMDGGDDEDLNQRVYPVDFSGDDLDVPGVEDDDADEARGSEDEENNLYSLGGDRHEGAEDDNPDVVI